MSFIAPAPVPVAVPPDAPAEADIACGDFLPAIVVATARDRMRLDGTATPARLRAELVEAAQSVAGELAEWIAQQQAAGHASLAAVPAPNIDGQSAHVARWHRAVECLAAANLTERMRGFDATADGHDRAEELEPTVDDLRRDARWAVRDILGRGRSTVELI